MKRLALLAAAALLGLTASAHAQIKLRDLVSIEGVRSNQLVGYGLVVGLQSTGDTLRNSQFTQQSLSAMLERMGVNVTGLQLQTRNTAAVVVTATLPAFARQGSPVDVQVSSLGDAKSLVGGTLMVTPLMGADGEVYAVAQGPVGGRRLLGRGRRSERQAGRADSGADSGGAEGPSVPLPAPVGEGRGVEALATQDGADPTGISGAIGIGQDAQLVLDGEGPAARAVGQFGRRSGWCRHNRRPPASVCADTSRCVDLCQEHGHDRR
jgi:hypothetical protein